MYENANLIIVMEMVISRILNMERKHVLLVTVQERNLIPSRLNISFFIISSKMCLLSVIISYRENFGIYRRDE